MDFVEKARVFATGAHCAAGNVRKYTGEPYVSHPIAVAGIVTTVPHTRAMLAASLLHDTVEDTHVTIEDIWREFGAEVATLVGWLSDVSRREDGNRATRKAKDREHLQAAPPAAKTIKLADVIENTQSIVAHDRRFAMTYLPEMVALVEVLKDGDPILWERANALVQDGCRALGLVVRHSGE